MRWEICFEQELVSENWEEVMPLLQAHYLEVAHFKDIPLDPDVDTYTELEKVGRLRSYSARSLGELVGYVVFFLNPNPHYKSSLTAYQDVLFLSKEHRGGSTAGRLLRFAEQRLAAEGVQVVYQHAKAGTEVGQFFERVGYELVDGIYAKRLDRN